MKTRREFLQDTASVSAGLLVPAMRSGSALADIGSGAGPKRPNIIFILADDMGFSDLGCYGSEIDTPNLDRLAHGGLRFTQFYSSPMCSPSRAALLTGRYPQQVGMALLADSYGKYPYPAYKSDLSDRCITIAEGLRSGGYQTAMCGKWHLTAVNIQSQHNWPCQRGFDKFFGTLWGAASYFDPGTLCRDNKRIRESGDGFYYTDAIGDNAVQYIDDFAKKDAPFFLYMAFTSPHYPLHAPAETIAKYKDHYRIGWDEARRKRHEREIAMGIVDSKWKMSPRDLRVPPWDLTPYKDWEMRRMEVYAAQIDRMDQNIGKVMRKLEGLGIKDDTLIFFMSDNGASSGELGNPWPSYDPATPHETYDGRIVRMGNDPSILPGADDTFQSYGIPWGNVSNTPFRYYKHYAHEGGISAPFIAYWPAHIRQANTLTHQVGHETDVLPTCLELAGVKYPSTYEGREIPPLVGQSLVPVLRGEPRERGPIFWECEGQSAVRQGKWKLVSAFPDNWELYDMESDRTELHNISDQNIAQLKEMIAMYRDWAKNVGVHPWPLPGMKLSPPGVPEYLERRNMS